MENFAREFMTKLDGKIPNEIMRIVLNELEMFCSKFEIHRKETEIVEYEEPDLPYCYKVYMVSKKIEGLNPKILALTLRIHLSYYLGCQKNCIEN